MELTPVELTVRESLCRHPAGSLKSSPVAIGVVAVAGLFAAGYLIKAVKS